MNARGQVRFAVAALLALAGCGHMYFLGATGSAPAENRGGDCRFEVLEGMPPRSFEELGVLAPEDIEYGSLADSSPEFVEKVKPLVCHAGGDAVVVEKNQWGRYVRGTVIKYR